VYGQCWAILALDLDLDGAGHLSLSLFVTGMMYRISGLVGHWRHMRHGPSLQLGTLNELDLVAAAAVATVSTAVAVAVAAAVRAHRSRTVATIASTTTAAAAAGRH
jgi:hypothetical protein